MQPPTVLITGAAKRLGAATARAFFQRGCNIALHYNHSQQQAQLLQLEFNQQRDDSCILLQADLADDACLEALLEQVQQHYARLDHLVNNASIFYPYSIIDCLESAEASFELAQFIQLNFSSPLKLSQLAAPTLAKHRGSIVNLIDIYADAGLSNHSFYVAAKSALQTATCQMAQSLAPAIRVNGVSPGAILWPDSDPLQSSFEVAAQQRQIIDSTALKRLGHPDNIAATIVYLALDAHYTTGSIIRVDGGRRDYI